MTKRICVLALLVGLMAGSAMAGTDTAKKEAIRLFKVMKMEKVLEQSIDQMLNLYIQQNNNLSPYRSVMHSFFNKHMSYESIKDEMATLYADTFSAKELADLINFYQTPTGQKAIEKMPELMARGSQIGSARIQENINELQKMIQEASEKIEKEKTDPNHSGSSPQSK